ncbi:tyrosine-type recombinase/integrase [Rhodohalobacter sulfatireducens]|uniref:Tyrosine-type recombinase/integrase n=1 Tax=Rhodohalobacter sulfatireducens TaxID=2911366 RepID=A0ABS9KHR0_9BACT|nr:site-specific integrase [Rhodohalobacter sulfatireducens]MCG2590386.1 tyrosine-type recombinase/integrase [Rhodohalobacter sulfatireducens]
METEKKQLNHKRLKFYPKPDKRVTLTDHEVGGLSVRIYPSGNKAFYYRYRWNDSVIDYKVGDYPDTSLSDAREEARELKGKVQDGLNPMAEKKARKQAPDVITVRDLIEDFKRDYLPKKKASTQSSYKSRINKIEKKFGKKSIEELTRRDVKRWLKKVAKKHPVNANRIQAIFSKIYSYAVKEDYTNNHPIKGLDKVGGKEKNRELNYTHDDIRNLWNAFETQREPMQSVLKMLLLTGQRLGETSRMKWRDIDQHNALWIIPKTETKGGETHIVPLTEMAIELLENVHQITGKKDYVFASPKKENSPLAFFGNVTDRIRPIAELPDFKIHDLRHIVITGMISLGVDMVHVGKAVSHKGLAKEYAITNRYSHYEFLDEKRKALERWNFHLKEILEGETETKFFKIG